MYTHIYIYIHICIYSYKYLYTYTFMYIHINVDLYRKRDRDRSYGALSTKEPCWVSAAPPLFLTTVHTYTHTRTKKNTHTNILQHTHTHTHTHTYAHTHTHIHTRSHTHTQTQTPMQKSPQSLCIRLYRSKALRCTTLPATATAGRHRCWWRPRLMSTHAMWCVCVGQGVGGWVSGGMGG